MTSQAKRVMRSILSMLSMLSAQPVHWQKSTKVYKSFVWVDQGDGGEVSGHKKHSALPPTPSESDTRIGIAWQHRSWLKPEHFDEMLVPANGKSEMVTWWKGKRVSHAFFPGKCRPMQSSLVISAHFNKSTLDINVEACLRKRLMFLLFISYRKPWYADVWASASTSLPSLSLWVHLTKKLTSGGIPNKAFIRCLTTEPAANPSGNFRNLSNLTSGTPLEPGSRNPMCERVPITARQAPGHPGKNSIMWRDHLKRTAVGGKTCLKPNCISTWKAQYQINSDWIQTTIMISSLVVSYTCVNMHIQVYRMHIIIAIPSRSIWILIPSLSPKVFPVSLPLTALSRSTNVAKQAPRMTQQVAEKRQWDWVIVDDWIAGEVLIAKSTVTAALEVARLTKTGIVPSAMLCYAYYKAWPWQRWTKHGQQLIRAVLRCWSDWRNIVLVSLTCRVLAVKKRQRIFLRTIFQIWWDSMYVDIAMYKSCFFGFISFISVPWWPRKNGININK